MRWIVSLFGLLLVYTQSLLAQPSNIDPSLFAHGTELFQEHCVICHGVEGDGKGPMATELSPKPTNLTLGVFKLRSTAIGEFPTQADIKETILNGIEGSFGTTMPAFDFLDDEDLRALTEVIRSIAYIEEFGSPVDVMPRPAQADLRRGERLFSELSCVDCHGETGNGQGLLAQELQDTNRMPIKPADFRVGQFKGGNAPEEIWMRIYTGLSGTPMPGFGINTTQEDIWAVSEYVMSFSK